MKNVSYTQGPWKAAINVAMAITPGHIIKADNLAETPIALVTKGGGTHGEKIQIANAYLIAAAPDLALALIDAMYQHDHKHLTPDEHWYHKAKRAIAKVKGK